MAQTFKRLILATIITLTCINPTFAAQYAQTFEALLNSQRAAGVTLSGGKAQFVTPGASPGTVSAPTNLKDIYTSRTKAATAANPYTLDSDGTAQIFGDGLYDVYVYNSAGVLKKTWLNVNISDVDATAAEAVIAALPQLYIGSYDTLNAAVTAIGSTPSILIINESTTCTDNTTIPTTLEVRFEKPGTVAVSNAKTLTINGPLYAGIYEIFTGTGTVVFGADSAKEIHPERRRAGNRCRMNFKRKKDDYQGNGKAHGVSFSVRFSERQLCGKGIRLSIRLRALRHYRRIREYLITEFRRRRLF